MFIVDRNSRKKIDVEISKVVDADYRKISIKRYFFKWEEEKDFDVYKLVIKGQDDILGLVSLDWIDSESRVEIRLLCASFENRGSTRKYERIAGNLIGFAAREAIKKYPNFPCISLIPKTELNEHYKTTYYMKEAGKSLFAHGIGLIKLGIDYE